MTVVPGEPLPTVPKRVGTAFEFEPSVLDKAVEVSVFTALLLLLHLNSALLAPSRDRVVALVHVVRVVPGREVRHGGVHEHVHHHRAVVTLDHGVLV